MCFQHIFELSHLSPLQVILGKWFVCSMNIGIEEGRRLLLERYSCIFSFNCKLLPKGHNYYKQTYKWQRTHFCYSNNTCIFVLALLFCLCFRLLDINLGWSDLSSNIFTLSWSVFNANFMCSIVWLIFFFFFFHLVFALLLLLFWVNCKLHLKFWMWLNFTP